MTNCNICKFIDHGKSNMTMFSICYILVEGSMRWGKSFILANKVKTGVGFTLKGRL